MDSIFIAILQKLVAEQGKDVLFDPARSKSFLADYTRNAFIKECRLLLRAIEAGVPGAIDEARDLERCKKQQVKVLCDEYFLSPRFAEDVVDTLTLVLSLTPREEIQEQISLSNAAIIKSDISKNEKPDNFVFIEGGNFLMGSPADEPERSERYETRHLVTVGSFYMGKCQVTQKEWTAVMENNPSHFKGENLPVENVNWYDAIEFCNKRSIIEGLTPFYIIDKSTADLIPKNKDDDKKWWVVMFWIVIWNPNANGYRLPTEAEWEYACRAGTTTPFNTGNNIDTNLANYNGKWLYNTTKVIYREKTTEVGSFKPNPWGLYDMHGNVKEWCWDWFKDYPTDAQTDPQGALSGTSRVLRGGSWDSGGKELRSASRRSKNPSDTYKDIGFRLVRSSSPISEK